MITIKTDVHQTLFNITDIVFILTNTIKHISETKLFVITGVNMFIPTTNFSLHQQFFLTLEVNHLPSSSLLQ